MDPSSTEAESKYGKIIGLLLSQDEAQVSLALAMVGAMEAAAQRQLFRKVYTRSLRLDFLEDLASAGGLQFVRAGLWLNGLKTLSEENAKFLGQKTGPLGLSGLSSLSSKWRALCPDTGGNSSSTGSGSCRRRWPPNWRVTKE